MKVISDLMSTILVLLALAMLVLAGHEVIAAGAVVLGVFVTLFLRSSYD